MFKEPAVNAKAGSTEAGAASNKDAHQDTSRKHATKDILGTVHYGRENCKRFGRWNDPWLVFALILDAIYM